ncbi:MAG: hypothetical protein PVI43_00505 [Candidatus Bathyarchaeota archaeon]
MFSSKSSRDQFVEENDGYNHWSGNTWDCRAIKKSEVTTYASNWSMTRNERVSPTPFTRECWMIQRDEFDDAPGCLGTVCVGNPDYDYGDRLFN